MFSVGSNFFISLNLLVSENVKQVLVRSLFYIRLSAFADAKLFILVAKL